MRKHVYSCAFFEFHDSQSNAYRCACYLSIFVVCHLVFIQSVSCCLFPTIIALKLGFSFSSDFYVFFVVISDIKICQHSPQKSE